MINLLPPTEKDHLLKENNWKMILILGILFLFFLISFSLTLFAIKFFVSGEMNTQKIIYQEKENQFKNSKIQILENNINSFNKQFLDLDKFYKTQPNFTIILEKILKSLPPKVNLTNVSFSYVKNEASFNVFGFATNRESLLELKDNLNKEVSFKEINFPASNWLQPEDINFSVTFKLK